MASLATSTFCPNIAIWPENVVAAIAADPPNLRSSSPMIKPMSPVANTALSSPAPNRVNDVVLPKNPLDIAWATVLRSFPVPLDTSMATLRADNDCWALPVAKNNLSNAGLNSSALTPVARRIF